MEVGKEMGSGMKEGQGPPPSFTPHTSCIHVCYSTLYRDLPPHHPTHILYSCVLLYPGQGPPPSFTPHTSCFMCATLPWRGPGWCAGEGVRVQVRGCRRGSQGMKAGDCMLVRGMVGPYL